MYYMETLVCVFQQVKDTIQQRHSYNTVRSLWVHKSLSLLHQNNYVLQR